MDGERNLETLLASMKPELHAGPYVFCVLPPGSSSLPEGAIMMFRESEATTAIVRKEIADTLGLDYPFVAAWITLTVHSSLQAVGLTAAVATALAREDISCNVVAGYYHDHLFVDRGDGHKAVEILRTLAKQNTL
jgi:uncharacterized protein